MTIQELEQFPREPEPRREPVGSFTITPIQLREESREAKRSDPDFHLGAVSA